MNKIQISSVPRVGDIGKDVHLLQSRIKEMGFDPGPIDSIFGAKVKQAVSAVQKANGLPGTGVIGPKTLGILGMEVAITNPGTGQKAITTDLKGRKSRSIHPVFRLMLEAKVFPGGKIPQCFHDMNVQKMGSALAIALESMNIREKGGNNRGKEVGFIQDIIGPYNPNGTGDAWCMSAMQIIVAFIEDWCQKESPVLDSEGCTVTFEEAKKIPGLVSYECEENMFVARYGKKWQGHTGWTLGPLPGNKMRTAEGNTGAESIRDGSGFFFRTRGQKQLASGGPDVSGWIRVYPNNKVPA